MMQNILITFRSGNRLALLNKTNSSNKNTWRKHFLPALPSHTKNSLCLNSRPCSLTLTSQSRKESIAKRSFPWRNWNRTISSAFCSSSKSSNTCWLVIFCGDDKTSLQEFQKLDKWLTWTLAQAFISCCKRRAYLPILCTGFNRYDAKSILSFNSSCFGLKNWVPYSLMRESLFGLFLLYKA